MKTSLLVLIAGFFAAAIPSQAAVIFTSGDIQGDGESIDYFYHPVGENTGADINPDDNTWINTVVQDKSLLDVMDSGAGNLGLYRPDDLTQSHIQATTAPANTTLTWQIRFDAPSGYTFQTLSVESVLTLFSTRPDNSVFFAISTDNVSFTTFHQHTGADVASGGNQASLSTDDLSTAVAGSSSFYLRGGWSSGSNPEVPGRYQWHRTVNSSIAGVEGSTLVLNTTVIPEPGTAALLGLGGLACFALTALRRIRRSRD